MAENSKIEWTDHTINFWWGCMKVSAGCTNCYAETFANRTGRNIWGPAATTERWRTTGPWRDILKWDKKAAAEGMRRRVFAQSMSDFFEDHPQLVPWREEAITILEGLQWLDVQLLTKRPENVSRMVPARWLENWPKHVWMGTSVEDQANADTRIPELLKIPAAIRFLSMEPLLGPVDLSGRTMETVWIDQEYADSDPELGTIVSDEGWPIHWIIVGGESGHNARPMHPDWALSLRDQCVAAEVPFFFKQYGEWYPDKQGIYGVRSMIFGDTVVHKLGKGRSGRLLDGREWSEFPRAEPIVEDMSELAAAWPTLANHPDGVDLFARYPIAGEPTGKPQ